MPDVIKKPLAGGRVKIIRQEVDDLGGKSVFVARHRIDGAMPCERYLSRGYITEAQAATAETMHKLYERGWWVKLSAGSLEYTEKPYPGSTDHTVMTDAAIDARKELLRRLERLEPNGASVVWKVCCEGWEASDWALARGVSREYAMGRLREALDNLGK